MKEKKTVDAREVERVWAHYLDVVCSKRRGPSPTLDDKRRKLIAEALRVRSLEVVCAAIDGLARSPHHNGENEQGVAYLDIRYALRGNGQRGEGGEERIDRMAGLADGVKPLRLANSRDFSRFDEPGSAA